MPPTWLDSGRKTIGRGGTDWQKFQRHGLVFLSTPQADALHEELNRSGFSAVRSLQLPYGRDWCRVYGWPVRLDLSGIPDPRLAGPYISDLCDPAPCGSSPPSQRGLHDWR